MQFKLSTIALALATLAVASRLRATAVTVAQASPVAAAMVVQASPPVSVPTRISNAATLFMMLPLIPSPRQFALTCNPVTAGGLGGGQCTANAVCCTDNSHNNFIYLGCTDIIL
ncbi:hypothetical protein C8J56DRAFT_1059977 [Mycena floridula]|nr:hypothetical protein C8J56DRAFT_1059977 [Mycena floridula]